MSKNLLILTTRYPHKFDEISSSFIYNLVNYQKNRFNRIVVISATPFIPSFLSKFFKSSRLLDLKASDYSYDNVQVHYLKNLFLPLSFGYNFRGYQGFRKARKYLKKLNLNFDIIHSHFSWPSGDIGIRLKKELKIPLFVTVHENRDWLIKEKENKYIRHVWQEANGLIRVNKIDVDLLSEYNNNVKFIPNGFDHQQYSGISKLEARKILKINKDHKIIYSLGNLIERKGFLDLLEAFNLCFKNQNHIKLFIGGNGPLRDKLQKYIDKNRLNNVKLLGYLPKEDLPLWMNASDIFTLASYSEGNPTVMFEALGCGKPVISTRVGGIPEIITNDDYGFLVDNNSKDIGNKLKIAINEVWDNNKIKRYGSNFSWEKIESETFNFFLSSEDFLRNGRSIS